MRSIVAILLSATAIPAIAQDPERGRVLYETFCHTCHYERVHERPPSRSLVKSQAELRAQVARWAERAPMRFTPQDVDDVAEYLNQSHYKLAK
jgi:mono/diheme cytochrome c family protein